MCICLYVYMCICVYDVLDRVGCAGVLLGVLCSWLLHSQKVYVHVHVSLTPCNVRSAWGAERKASLAWAKSYRKSKKMSDYKMHLKEVLTEEPLPEEDLTSTTRVSPLPCCCCCCCCWILDTWIDVLHFAGWFHADSPASDNQQLGGQAALVHLRHSVDVLFSL